MTHPADQADLRRLRASVARCGPSSRPTDEEELHRRSRHDWLVARAVRWLRGSQSCGVVMAEVIGDGIEQPDAIGWKHGGRHSILVECKTSRADFLRGLKKPFRRCPEMGMGQQRYYLTARGLLKPEDIPEGWGLLEVRKSRIFFAKRLPKLERYSPLAASKELPLLYSALRKVELGLPIDGWHA